MKTFLELCRIVLINDIRFVEKNWKIFFGTQLMTVVIWTLSTEICNTIRKINKYDNR